MEKFLEDQIQQQPSDLACGFFFFFFLIKFFFSMSDNNLFFFNTIICSMSRRVYVQWFVPYQVSNYTIIKKLKKKKKRKKKKKKRFDPSIR